MYADRGSGRPARLFVVGLALMAAVGTPRGGATIAGCTCISRRRWIEEAYWPSERFGHAPAPTGLKEGRLDGAGARWLAHGVHFTCDGLRRLGRAGVGVCHCPTSNATLASGFLKTARAGGGGHPVGSASDGSALERLVESDGGGCATRVMVNRPPLRLGLVPSPIRDAATLGDEGSARCPGAPKSGGWRPCIQATSRCSS